MDIFHGFVYIVFHFPSFTGGFSNSTRGIFELLCNSISDYLSQLSYHLYQSSFVKKYVFYYRKKKRYLISILLKKFWDRIKQKNIFLEKKTPIYILRNGYKKQFFKNVSVKKQRKQKNFRF